LNKPSVELCSEAELLICAIKHHYICKIFRLSTQKFCWFWTEELEFYDETT